MGREGGRDRLVPIVTLVTVIWPGGSMGSWEGVSLSLSLSLSLSNGLTELGGGRGRGQYRS